MDPLDPLQQQPERRHRAQALIGILGCSKQFHVRDHVVGSVEAACGTDRTRARADSRIPAIPAAARPCGRTWIAENRSSWASLVMNTRSSSPVASSTAPTTSSPSLRATSSQESLFAG